jgi:hypothetical protein
MVQHFSGATPTEPDGHVDRVLDMPLACPYKQVAALQPLGESKCTLIKRNSFFQKSTPAHYISNIRILTDSTFL